MLISSLLSGDSVLHLVSPDANAACLGLTLSQSFEGLSHSRRSL